MSHGGYFLCVEEKTILELVSLKGVVPRAGDTAQQSRALFALAEDPVWSPASTSDAPQMPVTPVPGDSMPCPSALWKPLNIHAHRHIYKHKSKVKK